MRVTTQLAVLAAAVVLAAVAATSSVAGTTTISTLASFSNSGISPFGKPTFASGGQTLVVPNNMRVLDSFALEVKISTSAIFRGEVYAWDGSEATGPNLWESGPTSTPTGASFQLMTFNPNVGVTPGEQLVVFVSVSPDFAANPPSGGLFGITSNPYPDGNVVELNDVGDTSLWTTTPWLQSGIYDFGFSATFSFTAAAAAAAVSPRGGYCAVAGDTWPDGSAIDPGTFLNLQLDQESSDPHYKGALPSAYFQGIGISCDDPPPGFHDTGTRVSEDGTPIGAAIYEYWVKS